MNLHHPLLKRILVAIGGALGLLFLAALVLPLFVNANRYKSQVETAATDALGMRVRIDGRLSVGLVPDVHLAGTEVRILDDAGTVVGSVARARFSVRVLPLLGRQLRMRRIELTHPALSIEQSPEGRWNVAGLKKAVALFGALDGGGVTISDGTVRYANKKAGTTYAASGLDLVVRGIRVAGGASPRRAARLSLQGRLACREVRADDLTLTSLEVVVNAKRGVFVLKPITMRAFGGEMEGSLRADESAPIPAYELSSSLPRFRIDEFLKTLWPSETLKGPMEFKANLSLKGTTSSALLESAAGHLSLRGESLTIMGTDLDQSISRFESSRTFNLVDVGAVLLTGPLGLAVKRGYNFAGLFRGTGGESQIGRLVSEWDVEHGVVRAKDVAMTTEKNRIALQGGLDIPAGRFADMAMAVVNEKGCATIRQAIRGPIENPEIEKPHVLNSLAGPVTGLLKKAKGLLPLGPCEAFYSGSVAPPNANSTESSGTSEP